MSAQFQPISVLVHRYVGLDLGRFLRVSFQLCKVSLLNRSPGNANAPHSGCLSADARRNIGAILDAAVLRLIRDPDASIGESPRQGGAFGYSGVRGLNALLATATTSTSAPVIVAQRLRQGAASPRDAKRLIRDALATVARLRPTPSEPVLVRADSAFYGSPTIGAAVRAGAQVSVTVRLDAMVKTAIASIAPVDPIGYTHAVRDPDTGLRVGRPPTSSTPLCPERPATQRDVATITLLF